MKKSEILWPLSRCDEGVFSSGVLGIDALPMLVGAEEGAATATLHPVTWTVLTRVCV